MSVFADRPFSGQLVAVFTDATGLSDRSMQLLARELNLALTAFVFPPRDDSPSPKVRLFTPLVELSRAGLPTIASVFALELEKRTGSAPASSPAMRPESRVVVEGADGPVSVAAFASVLTVKHELPVFGSVYPERETIAAMLSLRADQLASAPVQAVHSGSPYLMVGLKSVDALSQIQFRHHIWERTVANFEAQNLILFALRGASTGSLAHMRVLSPAHGLPEEIVTENACGPVLGYAIRYQLTELPEVASVTLRQAVEVGRPSALYATCRHEDSELTALRVGGQCFAIGEGSIAL